MVDRKSPALVLRRIPYGETSLVLHVFSRDSGKLSLLARGVRKRGSRLDPVLQTAQLIEVVYLEKESRDLQLLKDADLRNDFRGLRRDYSRLLAAAGICETLERSQWADHPDEKLFDAAVEMLGLTAGDCPHPANHVYWFLLFTLARSGYYLDLARCADCGKGTTEFASRSGVCLNLRGGALICPDCHHGSETEVVGARLLRVLHFLGRADPAEVGRREITRDTRIALGDFLDRLFSVHVEHWRSLNSLEELSRL